MVLLRAQIKFFWYSKKILSAPSTRLWEANLRPEVSEALVTRKSFRFKTKDCCSAWLVSKPFPVRQYLQPFGVHIVWSRTGREKNLICNKFQPQKPDIISCSGLFFGYNCQGDPDKHQMECKFMKKIACNLWGNGKRDFNRDSSELMHERYVERALAASRLSAALRKLSKMAFRIPVETFYIIYRLFAYRCQVGNFVFPFMVLLNYLPSRPDAPILWKCFQIKTTRKRFVPNQIRKE